MSEQREPYQAGEQPAAGKSLGEVFFEKVGRVEWGEDESTWYAERWGDMPPSMREDWEAAARAVEAEMLRRVVAHLDTQLEGLQDRPLVNRDVYGGFDWAVRVLQEYARRQQGEG